MLGEKKKKRQPPTPPRAHLQRLELELRTRHGGESGLAEEEEAGDGSATSFGLSVGGGDRVRHDLTDTKRKGMNE